MAIRRVIGLSLVLSVIELNTSGICSDDSQAMPCELMGRREGFGMTSPSTVQGRVMLIVYGLPGCAACILFYNLFLERLITFLAFIMKKCHERQIRRQNQNVLPNTGRRPSQQSDDNLESWKPSVYYVLLYLCIASTIIACVASVMYTSIEGWDYAESIYFCFVAFSTIGFGDLVTSQQREYPQPYLYRFGNFIFLTAGVCCIYSLYNVVSIVIKQLLNWVLKKLECNLCRRKKPRPRRNAITPGHLQRQVNSASKQQRNDNQANGVDITDVDSNYDSETDGRRMSGEMISMKDFLAANKVSLAVMQKQLYETSQHRKHHASSNGAFGLGQGVGGLAMLNNKLQETERRD
ncbi:potassium channel subfamily K member 13-like [Asterias rubens]|uniref:potassium channel subfamily K member 13-like n=1 Tax=Asterias rubens TaxID=7604 RepID=UPI0014554C8E|nr:potassium channel subfamily K member 13-like [Asterias rubens]